VAGIAGAGGTPSATFPSLAPGSAGGSQAGGDGGTAFVTNFGTSGSAGKGNQALGGAVSISHAAHGISWLQDLISCLSALIHVCLFVGSAIILGSNRVLCWWSVSHALFDLWMSWPLSELFSHFLRSCTSGSAFLCPCRAVCVVCGHWLLLLICGLQP
jgi:hypothetical protein